MSMEALPEGPLESAPIFAPWVVSGDPQASARFIGVSPDKRVRSGVWECTAGTFHWNFDFDEVVHVLDGHARVVSADRTWELSPGQVVFFPFGLETTWTVETRIRKFFVHRDPSTLVRLIRFGRLG